MTDVARGAAASSTAPPRRTEFLSFAPPLIGDEEIGEVVDTLRSPWITTGPKTLEFEERFRAYVGAEGALAVNSCTAAMHVALLTAGVGPGDEVVTTPLTFAATANVVEHVGARVVFADVDPRTLTIDPEQVAGAIGPRTRALIPVHYAGHPADMTALHVLARAHGLTVIEDAAHALPAARHDRMIGAGPNPVAFSFYATKNMTTAEGGMLTGDAEFLKTARVFSLHGMSKDAWKRYGKGGSWRYDVVCPGYKYNMTDLQAALGLHQLRRLAAFHARRREIAAAYTRAFCVDEALETPPDSPDVRHAWHLYVLRVRPRVLRVDRDRIIDELMARGIGTSVHFIPLHVQPFYRDKYGLHPADYPIAHANYLRMLSLPIHPGMTDDDVQYVIEAVLDLARQYRR